MGEHSYVASLESKLEKLEKRLAALDARQTGSINDSRSLGAVETGTRFRQQALIKKKQHEEDDGEIEDLVADLGYLCVVEKHPHSFPPEPPQSPLTTCIQRDQCRDP